MTCEDQELQKLLETFKPYSGKCQNSPYDDLDPDLPIRDGVKLGNLVQWSTSDGKRYFPTSHTIKKITPGAYEIQHSQTSGYYFEKIPVLAQGLLRFPHTNSDLVVNEIQKFWECSDIFKEYKLPHKRGLILWGPPGSGKSSTIQLIMKDVIEREGIVIRFTHPVIFTEGMRHFREIEPKTPVVILMEDIDSIIENYNESDVLNILDGVNQIDEALFLATTNYPEKLGGRILNRPSRFDKRFKIGHPNEASRKIYFEHLIGQPKIAELNINIEQWVSDTDGLSIAHLKELFVAVVILGDKYESAVNTLQSMKEEYLSSKDDEENNIGFKPAKRRRLYNAI